MARRSAIFRPFKRQAPDESVIAEAGADSIDGVLGLGGAAVDEVTRIGIRAGSDRARVRSLKSAVFSLSVTVEPASCFALSRADTSSDRLHRMRSSARNSAVSCSNVVSEETLLVCRSALTGRASMPRARRASRRPSSP